MLSPLGSNVCWSHPHCLCAPRVFPAPQRALQSSPLTLSPLPILHTLCYHHIHISGDSALKCAGLPSRDVIIFLTCAYCFWGLRVCWWNTKTVFCFFFLFLHPMLMFTVIIGEEIERKMEVGIKVSIALHYQNQPMRQYELKVRTRSLKSVLCTCCQTLPCSVHRIWIKTLSHSKPQFLISRKGMMISTLNSCYEKLWIRICWKSLDLWK